MSEWKNRSVFYQNTFRKGRCMVCLAQVYKFVMDISWQSYLFGGKRKREAFAYLVARYGLVLGQFTHAALECMLVQGRTMSFSRRASSNPQPFKWQSHQRNRPRSLKHMRPSALTKSHVWYELYRAVHLRALISLQCRVLFKAFFIRFTKSTLALLPINVTLSK